MPGNLPLPPDIETFRAVYDAGRAQVVWTTLVADLETPVSAMLKLALKVASQSGEVTSADLEEAEAAGFDREDLWDIGAITAFFALSNRMANFSSMRPNDEFFAMGRGLPD